MSDHESNGAPAPSFDDLLSESYRFFRAVADEARRLTLAVGDQGEAEAPLNCVDTVFQATVCAMMKATYEIAKSGAKQMDCIQTAADLIAAEDAAEAEEDGTQN